MTLTPEQLDDLKRKHEAATPGPWTKCVMGGVAVGELRENTLAVAAGGEGELFCIEPECGYYIGQERFDDTSASEQAHRDEAFLVELRNRFPDLEQFARFGLLAKAFCEEHGNKVETVLLGALGADSWMHFCALLEAARALDGKERT